ncbi:hypothetical protein BD779DRAFT_936260 [Infundibulicybe gibba]|nr:hypothetical protein BD779DRAFT_936260 [Infundibulicybe gibba]
MIRLTKRVRRCLYFFQKQAERTDSPNRDISLMRFVRPEIVESDSISLDQMIHMCFFCLELQPSQVMMTRVAVRIFPEVRSSTPPGTHRQDHSIDSSTIITGLHIIHPRGSNPAHLAIIISESLSSEWTVTQRSKKSAKVRRLPCSLPGSR